MARCFFRRAPHLPNNHQISAALQSLGIVAPKVHAECLLLGIARGAASEGALWSQTLVLGPPLPPQRNVVGACPFPDLSGSCNLVFEDRVEPTRPSDMAPLTNQRESLRPTTTLAVLGFFDLRPPTDSWRVSACEPALNQPPSVSDHRGRVESNLHIHRGLEHAVSQQCAHGCFINLGEVP